MLRFMFTAIPNVAVNKTSFQSSTVWESVPGQAVDGDTNGQWADNACSHTDDITQDTNPWWTVDLGGTYDVSEVVLYNRADCCGM
jgi:hypothetical protein